MKYSSWRIRYEAKKAEKTFGNKLILVRNVNEL